MVQDPRVQNRTYVFQETGEELPWAVFVSSKVRRGQKAPMILALRGADGTPLTFLRAGAAVNLAEEGGYILVGPMGYNSRGNYGNPPRARGAAPANAGPGSATASQPEATPVQPGAPAASAVVAPPAAAAPARGTPPIRGGTKETDPAKVSEYSEKDVLNVFSMARKEFSIDEDRIYLMGHSQGGGGALRFAEKYSSYWAGVALLAPAVFSFQPTESSNLRKLPLLIMIGDADTLLTGVSNFDKQLMSLSIAHEYKVMPGLDHSTIIMGSMPDVYTFFGKHTKR